MRLKLMNRLLQVPVLLVIALMFSGCVGLAPLPETNAERLALMELSYANILDKAKLYADEDRLTEAQMVKLNESFDAIEGSINLAKTAMALANQLDFDNNAKSITSALSVIRALLVEAEQ